MEETLDYKSLLVRRKLTRSLSDLLKTQMKSYLGTLTPLLHPGHVFGSHVQGRPKDLVVRGADKAWKDLQTEFADVIGGRPFNLPSTIESPFEVVSASFEVSQRSYLHTARTSRETKQVTVTSPLRWVVSAQGYTPERLREILNDRNRTAAQVRESVLHFLLVNAVLVKQTGIAQILEELHYPVSTERWPELGELPITVIQAAVATRRPSDEVIVESTEISGNDSFEEFVDVSDVMRMRDAYKERLLEVVRQHDPSLLG